MNEISVVYSKLIPRKWRKIIYKASVVIGLILIAVGKASNDTVDLWLSNIGALLAIGGNGLAIANSPVAAKEPEGD